MWQRSVGGHCLKNCPPPLALLSRHVSPGRSFGHRFESWSDLFKETRQINIEMNRTKKDSLVLEGWREDPRMVFLANPGRDLTTKERK